MGKLRDRIVQPRYIAAILAAIIGIRILSAMAILVLWFPDLMADPKLFSRAESLFPFIYGHQGEWRSALFAGVLSSALAIPLAVLLTRYFSEQNAVAESMLIIGIGGFLIDVVATTMNFLGTLWLAQRYMADPEIQALASFVWEWVEVWRDDGLKTISFISIGVFTVWLARTMRSTPDTKWIQISTWLFGAVMLLIGILDALGLFELGEYGIASGFGHIFYALWGLSIGHWFWFKAPPRVAIGDAPSPG